MQEGLVVTGIVSGLRCGRIQLGIKKTAELIAFRLGATDLVLGRLDGGVVGQRFGHERFQIQVGPRRREQGGYPSATPCRHILFFISAIGSC